MDQVISFEEFKGDCRHLAAVIAERQSRNLFGVMRGGMIVTLFIAHELKKSSVRVHPIYNGGYLPYAPGLQPHKNDIIIDDIFDTGKTELDLLSTWPHLTLAVLYSKNRKLTPKTVLVGRYIETTDYLILPHEIAPDNVERL